MSCISSSGAESSTITSRKLPLARPSPEVLSVNGALLCNDLDRGLHRLAEDLVLKLLGRQALAILGR
jgi:hypothetical protein